MSVTSTHLLAGSSTLDSGSPYETASVSPTPGKLYLLGVNVTGVNPGPLATAVTGLGLTWTRVATSTGSGVRNEHIFAASGTPAPGTMFITIASGGNPPTGCSWLLSEHGGADLSGGAAAAIVQSVFARNAALTTTTATFPNPIGAGNATYAIVGANVLATPDAPWTLLGNATYSTPTSAIMSMFAAPGQQIVSATLPTAQASVPVGIEIKAAASAPTNLDKLRLGAGTTGLRYGSTALSKAYLGATQNWP